MTYVINPLWFYIADLVDSLVVATFVISICVLIVIIMISVDLAEELHNYTSDQIQSMMKCRRILAVVGIVLMLFTVALPSKDTIYKMMIAKAVTYENIEKGDKYIEKRLEQIFNYIKDDKKKGNRDDKRN